ncbi:MAG: hypothetical protein WBA45_13570 [Microthrixaceae bacterium]
MEPEQGPSRTTKIVILALLAVFLLAGVGAILAAIGLFGSDNGSVTTSDASSTDADSGKGNPTEQDSSTPSPTTSPGDDTTSVTLGSPSGEPALEGAATTPVSVPFPAQETSLLKSVRAASHEGFDRVVFEFDGKVPGYVVQYIPGPLTEDPSDRPVSLKGAKILLVTMNPASGVDLSGVDYEVVYSGPQRIEGPGSPIEELVRSGDFESVLTWAVGTTGERPFKVTTLESPTRLVIDVED